jgi:peptidoglycan/xylan/chitin deacetylase (PgdA/CDA1 family)/lipid II:glycine glycyltransferase (peptidoglycan interpeptide bridge formation enzyme)
MMCALVWAILTGFGRFRRDGVVALCYHGVSAKQRERFAWQMSKIRSRVVDLAECRASTSSCAKLPYVSMTFDDAFANLMENALPILEQYQIPATIFAVADNLGCLPRWEMPDGHPESTERTMTDEQLVTVSKNPLIRIGSHTLTHPDLTRIRPDQLKTELIDSKRRLEQLLGNPIEDLALPFGSYDQEVLRMAREAGYKRIYTVDTRPANPMSQEPVTGRFAMSPDVWKIEFILTCAGVYAWLYPWRRFIHRVKRWFSLARRNNQMTTTIRPINRDEWQRLAPTFMDYNYCQFWDYGIACARKVGAYSEHVAIYKGDDLLGLTDVRVKKIPIFRTGIAYINSGPLVRRNNQSDAERLRRVLSGLADEYVKKRKLVLRIQPFPSSSILLDRQEQIFLDIGFTAPNQLHHNRTIVLNISQPLEIIRKQFDRSWRRHLNKAEKLNVVTGTDDSLFSGFCQIYEELINRKSFDVHLDANFYCQLHRLMSGNEKFIISIIYENELPAAGRVYSFVGDTCLEILAATNDLGLKNGASYLAVWSIIQKAKEKGCRFYDLCGIDPAKNPGGYQFKKGTGGDDITIPTFEIYPNSWSKNTVHLGEWVYRLYRKARKS